ncbi:MAG: hypothetical protein ABWY52_04205 [Candidatus Limnocylindrales bacterium]
MTRQEGPANDPRGANEPADAGPSPERAHDALLRLIAVALFARALLSLADAAALATGGMGVFELGGIAHADGSPVWPILWGGVALAAAALLSLRRSLGWVLGAGVCVAYLVVGVAHAVDATSSHTGLPAGVWLIFAADVLVPSLVLAGLFTVRPWFLATTRAARPEAGGRAPIR